MACALLPVGHQLPRDWIRGLNLTSYSDAGYSSPTGLAALRRARDDVHADTIALVPTWYVTSLTDPNLAPVAGKSPSFAALRRAAVRARALGLRVIVKPHVDVLDGSFRGDLRPSDLAAFYARYTTLLDQSASLAADADASLLVVGTELSSLASDADRWRGLIASARKRFSGQLTFAANWIQGAEQIKFWDALDVVGIDAYMPLVSAPSTGVQDLVAGWAQWKRRIAALHVATGRDVMFTELGYQPRTDTAARPYNGSGPLDVGLQARCYEAALRVWGSTPWFRGIVWWDWSADGLDADPTNLGYSPRGKPAAGVLAGFQR